MRKTFTIFSLIIALFGTSMPAFAQTFTRNSFSEGGLAQSTQLQEAKTSVVEKVADLQSAKGAEDEGQKRLDALKSVVDFSILETKGLLEKLMNIKNLSEEEAALHAALQKDLTAFLAFQEEFSVSLTATGLTLDDVKALAAQYKTWRDETYNARLQEVIHFILTFQIRDIIEIGALRFKKLAESLRRLESSKLIDVKKLEPLLENAGDSLRSAAGLHAQALEQLFAPYATATPAIGEEEAATSTLTSEVPDEEPLPEIPALIEGAITHVKEAYEQFLLMSAMVKEMLTR